MIEDRIRSEVTALRHASRTLSSFDAYIVVDWSARATPATGKDSIWWAELAWRDAAEPSIAVRNPETRESALEELTNRLTGPLSAARVLVGFDFPLGYPRGLARALGYRGPPSRAWRHTWTRLATEIEDDARNRNNRFRIAARLNAKLTGAMGPFYGRPRLTDDEIVRHLPTARRGCFEYPLQTQSGVLLARARLVDRSARTASNPWFVYGGANSVGGQALVGIPRVAALRARIADARVWPFETGAALPPPSEARVVLAEVYPTLFHARQEGTEVHDRLQVMATALHLARLDVDGSLLRLLRAPDVDTATVHEEGWILGVP